MNIYLVGFMGTGKSTVGRELAARVGWRFADIDELIEFKEKRTISDIFAKDGEAYFRKIENKALKYASSQSDFVYACGGGIVMDPANIDIMKKTGIMVCLSATPGAILERTSKSGHRPLLNVKDPQKQISLLLKMRSPCYARADISIDTTKLPVKQVVSRIIKAIKT